MNQLKKALIGAVIAFGTISLLKDQIGLVRSYTDSLPYHYFLALKKMSPQKGDYTCIDSSWHGDKVIKEIVGIPGDELLYDAAGNLWVGRRYIGKSKKKATDGRSLTPIKPGLIPDGYVFVKGDHERSFDSRYEQLGLVAVKDLQGRLVALA